LGTSPFGTKLDQSGRQTGTIQRWTEEPFGLVRLVVGAIVLLGTVLAISLALATRDLRMLELVGALWAVYGLMVGFLYGVLEPVIDGFAQLMANIGLDRAGDGYSSIETLAAHGHFEAAAEEYAERARNARERAEATLRRAELLAGPLAEPETAAVELDSLRAHPRSARDDFRIGLALVDLYEHHLNDHSRAMIELRRLIDQRRRDDSSKGGAR